jgi:hypothetical protein
MEVDLLPGTHKNRERRDGSEESTFPINTDDASPPTMNRSEETRFSEFEVVQSQRYVCCSSFAYSDSDVLLLVWDRDEGHFLALSHHVTARWRSRLGRK